MCSKPMAQGGWVVLIWQEGGMSSITVPPCFGTKELEPKGDAQSLLVGREAEVQCSSLITMMHDSMSTGDIRHKISYFLFSLICSEKAFEFVLLHYKEGILFSKCIRSKIWQSNWILQSHCPCGWERQWSKSAFVILKTEEFLFHIIFQHCLGWFGYFFQDQSMIWNWSYALWNGKTL